MVKLYSYEKPLEEVVTRAREEEFRWLKKANYLKSHTHTHTATPHTSMGEPG